MPVSQVPISGKLITAIDSVWSSSADRNWIVGRLGVRTGATTFDIDVVGRAGIVYVSLGNDGGLGQATALDAVGVAKTDWQMVKMRRENGELVIREAEAYAAGGGGGGSTNLNGLTDVTISAPSHGQALVYDVFSGQWINGTAGGGGAIYTAGEAIDIDVSNVISVKRYAAGAVVIASGGLAINVGNGISIQSNALALNLSSVPGLEYGSGADAGKLQVKITDGIQRTAAGIGVKVTPNVGLDVDATGVSVDVTDIIDTAFGLTEAANKIRLSLDTNTGLNFGGGGGLKLGTPATLAFNSANSVTSATHSHAITSASDVGSVPAQALLSSTGAGGLTLGPLTLYGNIIFGGGSRSILGTNNITIAPNADLILDPAGLVLAPNAQDIRTVTINDLPTGIDGFRIWNRYANYTQLTIGAIKADELYVRVFVADETRIDRGEEYWSKSFGIVQADFTMPAVGSTADVWFEDAPAAVTFNLFANGDYLLMRTIDWGTGLVVQKVWWQVAAAKLAQETTAVNGVDRQQWRIQRIAGGIDGSLIKRGNMMLDTGVVGQGWVHLSALSQDGGPFIQIGAMTSVSTVPQFTNYVRMGNLNGTVDYSSNVWGIAAGSGSSGIGTAPSAGFSGFAAEGTNGLRLFNTSILMYSGGVLGTSITNTNGIRLLQDTVVGANVNRYIEWFSTLGPPIADANRRGTIRSFQDAGRSGMQIYSLGGSAAEAYIEVGAQGNGKSVSLQFSTNSQTATFVTATTVSMLGNLGVGTASPTRQVHAKNDQNAATLIYVENQSTGAQAVAGFVAEAAGASLTMAKTSSGYTPGAGVVTNDAYLYNSVRGDIAIINGVATGSIRLTAGAATIPHLTVQATGFVQVNNGSSNGGAVAFAVGTVNKGYMAAAGTTNAWVPGSAAGDLVIRAEAGKILFTMDAAATLHAALSASSTVTEFKINAPAAGQSYFSAYLGGTLKGLYGAAGAANALVAGSAAGDMVLRSEGGRILFTPDAGAGAPFVIKGDSAIGIGKGALGASNAYVAHFIPAVSNPASVNIDATSAGSGQYGVVFLRANGGYIQFAGYGTTFSATRHGQSLTNAGEFLTVNFSRLLIGTIDAAPIYIGTNNTLRMAVMDDGQVRIGPDSAGLVGSASGLQVGAQDKHIIRATLYGTAGFTLVGARAGGTAAAPTQLGVGNVIMAIGAHGYTNAGWSTVVNGEIDFRATEDYNGGVTSKGGCEILIYTRPNGSASLFNAMRIYENGAIEARQIYATNIGGPNAPVYVRSDGMLGLNTSSARFKRDIRALPDSYGDSFMMALEPVIYKGEAEDNNDYAGFIAEKVDEAAGAHGARLMVGYDKGGLPLYLRYDLLTVPIIAAVQGLIPYKARIAELEARISELERKLH